MQLRFYHNPRCRKSRAGLEYLRKKTDNFVVIEYLKEPLNDAEIDALLTKLEMEPLDLVRKQEEYYKKLLKGARLTREDWIKEFSQNLKLIKRPILVKGDKAIIADPPETMDPLL